VTNQKEEGKIIIKINRYCILLKKLKDQTSGKTNPLQFFGRVFLYHFLLKGFKPPENNISPFKNALGLFFEHFLVFVTSWFSNENCFKKPI